MFCLKNVSVFVTVAVFVTSYCLCFVYLITIGDRLTNTGTFTEMLINVCLVYKQRNEKEKKESAMSAEVTEPGQMPSIISKILSRHGSGIHALFF